MWALFGSHTRVSLLHSIHKTRKKETEEDAAMEHPSSTLAREATVALGEHKNEKPRAWRSQGWRQRSGKWTTTVAAQLSTTKQWLPPKIMRITSIYRVRGTHWSEMVEVEVPRGSMATRAEGGEASSTVVELWGEGRLELEVGGRKAVME